MKGFKQYLGTIATVSSLLLVSHSVAAMNLNPVKKWYVGFTGGASFLPSVTASKKESIPLFDKTFTENYSLSYNPGGGGSIELGYRCNKFRFELEGLFNYNAFHQITMGKYTFTSGKDANLSFNGDTYYPAGFFNILYELYAEGTNKTNWAPYVGVGVGYGGIYNVFNLTYQGSTFYTYSKHHSVLMGQAIAGLGYFMDDYTFVGLDYRYVGSQKYGDLNLTLKDNTVNVSFTFALGG